MAQRTLTDDLRDMSGEDLLLVAAMSNRTMREAIEAELARRTAARARRARQIRVAKPAARTRLVA